jgi:hypothetical protein
MDRSEIGKFVGKSVILSYKTLTTHVFITDVRGWLAYKSDTDRFAVFNNSYNYGISAVQHFPSCGFELNQVMSLTYDLSIGSFLIPADIVAEIYNEGYCLTFSYYHPPQEEYISRTCKYCKNFNLLRLLCDVDWEGHQPDERCSSWRDPREH